MPSTSKILLADSRHAFGREALGLGHDRESVEAPNTKQHSLTDLLLFARSFVLLVSIVVVVATLMRVPCVACACACMRLCVRVSCVAQAIIDAVEGRTPATPRGTASASMPPLVFHHDPTTPSPPLSPHGGGSVTPKRPPPSHMAPPSSAPPPPRRVIEKKYAPSFHISFHPSHLSRSRSSSSSWFGGWRLESWCRCRCRWSGGVDDVGWIGLVSHCLFESRLMAEPLHTHTCQRERERD